MRKDYQRVRLVILDLRLQDVVRTSGEDMEATWGKDWDGLLQDKLSS